MSLLLLLTGDGAAAAEITGAGAIASAESHGGATLAAGIASAGLASSELHGSATLAVAIEAAGLASAEAMGQPTVTPEVAAQNIVDAGNIASAEAIGTALISADIATAVVITAEAHGAPELQALVADVAKTGFCLASHHRYPRKWKTTEEILRARRKQLRYIHEPKSEAPIIKTVKIDLDYDRIANRISEVLIERNTEYQRKALINKRKKASAMMLLDS